MDFDFISINEVLNSVANCSRVESPMDSIESTMTLSNEELSDASKFYIAKSCGGYSEDELSNALKYQQGAGDLIEALKRHRHSRAGSNGFPMLRFKPTDKESTNPVTANDLIYILQSPASWYQRIIYDSLAIRERLLSEKEVSVDQLFKRASDAPKVKPYHSINEDMEATSLRVGFERQPLIDWLRAEEIKFDQGVSPTLAQSKEVTITNILQSRRNILDPHIETARKQAEDPNDSQEVWLELVSIAESKKQPFTGTVDKTSGIHYNDGGETKFLSKKALSSRLSRKRITR